MLLSEMIEMFLDSRKRGMTGAKKKCSKPTLRIYQDNLKCFYNFLAADAKGGGVLDYAMIKRLHMSAFLDYLDAKLESKALAKASVLQVLRSLRTFFRWVDKDEDCKRANLEGLQRYLPAIEENPRREYIPDNGDLKKWKHSFNVKNRWGYRDYVMFNLMLSCGARLGEVCNLELSDLNFESRIIVLDGKTGPRPVPLFADLIPLLKGWLKRREGCPTAKDSTYLFVTKYRPSVSVKAFGYRLRKHKAKHNLPRLTAHTLRHAFATYYLKNNGNMEYLRTIIGHKTYEMVRKYLHIAKVASKEMQEEFNRVNPLKGV